MPEAFGGIAAILIFVFIIILFILWIILPFLIVGTNKRLNRLIFLVNENNKHQADIKEDMKKLADEAEKSLNQEG